LREKSKKSGGVKGDKKIIHRNCEKVVEKFWIE